MWNPASIADMMNDDLDVTEAIVLNHIMAILYMPYSNRGMKDLLKLNEIASTMRTEIILARSNKTIQAHTPLVLTEAKMNVMTEPLH